MVPRPGNAGWAGTSDGVAARGFVNGRGLPRSGGRESTAGAHRSEVPARRQTRTREHGPCLQAGSAWTSQTSQKGRSPEGSRSFLIWRLLANMRSKKDLMIAAYIRVSTDKQNLANQKEEIQRFAREQGMEIDVWVKETISGKTPSGKRKLGWLMRKVRKGDTLIVSEISRLSRSLTEIMEIMGKCLEKNIRLYTVKERYSFDDSINSKVLCFAFGLVAEIERNLISMRTKEALAVKRSEGVILGRRKGSSPKIKYLQSQSETIEHCLAEGRKVRDLCRELGVSRNTWYRYLKLSALSDKEKAAD